MESRHGATANHLERPDDAAGALPIVIAIASSLERRIQLTEVLDGVGPLVLVSTVKEARDLLGSAPLPALRPPVDTQVIVVADVEVDTSLHLARRRGRQVELSPLELDLLVCRSSTPRRVWTHESLHESVWHCELSRSRAGVHSVVKRLRRKLAELMAPLTIDAIRGVGYRLSEHTVDGATVRSIDSAQVRRLP